MKTPIKGKKIIFLFRPHDDAATMAGAMLALTTDNSISYGKDADTTTTKDGTIRTPNAAEIEISASTLLPENDTMIGTLKQAMLNDALLDIWRVNLAAPTVYSLTSDTAVNPNKTYYTRTGSTGSYVYTAVANPVSTSLSSYYEATKFAGTYFQGYMTSFEESSPAEGTVECSMNWAINGKGADGDVTVSAVQQEEAEYVFIDSGTTNG